MRIQSNSPSKWNYIKPQGRFLKIALYHNWSYLRTFPPFCIFISHLTTHFFHLPLHFPLLCLAFYRLIVVLSLVSSFPSLNAPQLLLLHHHLELTHQFDLSLPGRILTQLYHLGFPGFGFVVVSTLDAPKLHDCFLIYYYHCSTFLFFSIETTHPESPGRVYLISPNRTNHNSNI